MKILAYDTTSKTAYVSLSEVSGNRGGIRITPYAGFSFAAESHTTALIKMTDSILSLTSFTLDDVDLYAVSVGPGSFTGVRIGVSAIKGFAFADNKACVGVPSLEALAYSLLGCRGIVTPLIDARRGTCYTSAYLMGEKITRLSAEEQLDKDEYLSMITELSRKYPDEKLIMTGDGAEMMAEAAAREGIKADTLMCSPALGASGAAYEKYISSPAECFDSRSLQPVYLKKSQAEREREEKLKESLI